MTDPLAFMDHAPTLSDQTANVWLFDLRKYTASDFSKILSDTEKEKADRFRKSSLKNDYVISHGLLRIVLSHYASLRPEEVAFAHNAWGKPELAHSEDLLRFNFSHSAHWTMIGVARRNIGVDVECIRELKDLGDLAKTILTDREFVCWQELKGSQRERVFFQAWTRKESFVKATGRGLSLPLKDFEVLMGDEDQVRLLSSQVKTEFGGASWMLRDVSVDETHLAAICVEGGARDVHLVRL
jgi:4'-phosphopantetheinyl transferase